MRVVCSISMGVGLPEGAAIRPISAATQNKLEAFHKQQAADWDIFTDPFISSIYKLHSSRWIPEQSLLEVKIDIDLSKIKSHEYPAYIFGQDPSVKSIAVGSLYHYMYGGLERSMKEKYINFLHKSHMRNNGYYPFVNKAFVNWK